MSNVCKGCQAPVKWITTTKGKNMIVDPKLVTIVTKGGSTYQGFIPHWATCPVADRFKNKPSPGIADMQWQCPKCRAWRLKGHDCPECGTSHGKE